MQLSDIYFFQDPTRFYNVRCSVACSMRTGADLIKPLALSIFDTGTGTGYDHVRKGSAWLYVLFSFWGWTLSILSSEQ